MLRIQNRKLVLVCDLDQTLVHASVDQSIEPLLQAGDSRVKDVFRIPIPGNLPHFIRLRSAIPLPSPLPEFWNLTK